MEVVIMGQSYVLSCPEGREAEMLAAVAQVDREMNAIRAGGKVKARERIAVLAALNMAFSMPERAPDRPPAAGNSAAALDILIQRIDQAIGADGQLL